MLVPNWVEGQRYLLVFLFVSFLFLFLHFNQLGIMCLIYCTFEGHFCLPIFWAWLQETQCSAILLTNWVIGLSAVFSWCKSWCIYEVFGVLRPRKWWIICQNALYFYKDIDVCFRSRFFCICFMLVNKWRPPEWKAFENPARLSTWWLLYHLG